MNAGGNAPSAIPSSSAFNKGSPSTPSRTTRAAVACTKTLRREPSPSPRSRRSQGGRERGRQGNPHCGGEPCSSDCQGYMEGGAQEGQRAAVEVLGDYGMK